MQYAVKNEFMIHQLDVNAPIDCELFMTQPEGYI